MVALDNFEWAEGILSALDWSGLTLKALSASPNALPTGPETGERAKVKSTDTVFGNATECVILRR